MHSQRGTRDASICGYRLLDRRILCAGPAAREAVRAIKSIGKRPLVTSQLILIELLDGTAKQGPYVRKLAVQYIERLLTDEAVRVVPMTDGLFVSAFALYSQRPDKAWSLTDFASIVICQQEGITDVLAHDRHFEQAGFRALLRENP